MKKILITLTILFASIQVYAGSLLIIKAEIFSGEKSLGTPTLLVNQNTDASVAVEGSYKLTLNATEIDNNTIFIVSER